MNFLIHGNYKAANTVLMYNEWHELCFKITNLHDCLDGRG
jgi:hypothetical protein